MPESWKFRHNYSGNRAIGLKHSSREDSRNIAALNVCCTEERASNKLLVTDSLYCN